MSKRVLGFFVISLLLAYPAIARRKWLNPQPTAAQKIMKSSDGGPVLSEAISNISAFAAIEQLSGGIYRAWIGFRNAKPGAIDVEPELFFLVNAHDKALYRFSDYELRNAAASRANLPLPPPPLPRRYYTITGRNLGNYTIRSIGTGYYFPSGFSTDSHQVEENYDYRSAIGNQTGAAAGQHLSQKKARQYIEWLDKTYLGSQILESDQKMQRMLETHCLDFKAHNVSDRLPVTLILIIDDVQFRFKFDKSK